VTTECIRIIKFRTSRSTYFDVAGGSVFAAHAFRWHAIAVVSHDGVDVGIINDKDEFIRLSNGRRECFGTHDNWFRWGAWLRAHRHIRKYLRGPKPGPGIAKTCPPGRPICREVD
jgi:hypothetical protein